MFGAYTTLTYFYSIKDNYVCGWHVMWFEINTHIHKHWTIHWCRIDNMASQIIGNATDCSRACLVYQQKTKKHLPPNRRIKCYSFVRRIPKWPIDFPYKGPTVRSIVISLVWSLDKLLSKQSRYHWFETKWCSRVVSVMCCGLWRVTNNRAITSSGLPSWSSIKGMEKNFSLSPVSYMRLNYSTFLCFDTVLHA